jgi:hypothetical protein
VSGGLLIRGVIVPVDGVTIANPTDTTWAKLDGGDYRPRRPGEFVHQVILHTTKGLAKQYVRAGAGPGNADKLVADFWRNDPEHSAAQIVVDTDGTAACLCDLATIAAYHATASNPWSVGIEMYQMADGGVFDATLNSTVKIVLAICDAFAIPLQIPKLPYANRPLARMVGGGPDCYGVFGHRDNTSRRGWGDPGDEINNRLELAGAERFDFDQREDIATWTRRQKFLNAMFGEKLAIDGKPLGATRAAMLRHGFKTGKAIPA